MFINFQNNNKSYYNSDEIYLIEYIYKEKPQAYDIVYIGQGQILNYINNWSQSSDVSGVGYWLGSDTRYSNLKRWVYVSVRGGTE